jgi:UPF0716 protein FxsA
MVLFGLIAWPILEIYVFIQVGEWLGWINTVLLFLGAGVAGLWLMRAEGISLLMRARAQMQNGVAPIDQAFDALCLVAGGVLLLLPGFLTDIAALVLFLPPTRAALKRMLARHAIVHGGHYGDPRQKNPMGRDADLVIEGEFEEVSPSGPNAADGATRTPLLDSSGNVVPKRD